MRLRRLFWKTRWGKKRPTPQIKIYREPLLECWRYEFAEGIWYWGYGQTFLGAYKKGLEALNAPPEHFCKNAEECTCLHPVSLLED